MQRVICSIAHNLAISYSATHSDKETQQLALTVFFSAVELRHEHPVTLQYTLNLAVYNAIPQPNVLQVLDEDDRQIAAFCAFPL